MGHAFVYLLLIASSVCNSIIAQENTTTTTDLPTNIEYITITDTPTSSYAVPSKPRELKVLDIFPDAITLSWTSPEKPNGAIDGYRVYYMYGNFTEVQPDQIKYSKPHITYNLTNLSKYIYSSVCPKPKQTLPACLFIVLPQNAKTRSLLSTEPQTEYKIWVKAYTVKNEGDSSDPVTNTTDIDGPSAPRILNLSCQAQDTIFIQWERPKHFFYSIDYYYVYINLDNRLFRDIPLSALTEHLETTVNSSLNFFP